MNVVIMTCSHVYSIGLIIVTAYSGGDGSPIIPIGTDGALALETLMAAGYTIAVAYSDAVGYYYTLTSAA